MQKEIRKIKLSSFIKDHSEYLTAQAFVLLCECDKTTKVFNFDVYNMLTNTSLRKYTHRWEWNHRNLLLNVIRKQKPNI